MSKSNNKKLGNLEIKNMNDSSADLYLYGDIVSSSWESYWADEATCPQDITEFLKELDNTKELNIYINSGGGSVFAGIAIYNLLKRHQATKTVHVDGIAASIASVIAMAGDNIIIPNNAQLMIHKPLCGTGGNADDLRKTADILDQCQKSITDIYMQNVKEGITEQEITDLINNETWMTGQEASQYFNIQVESQSEIYASASEYFKEYKNTPEYLKAQVKKSENKNKVNELEKIKNEILEDLDLI